MTSISARTSANNVTNPRKNSLNHTHGHASSISTTQPTIHQLLGRAKLPRDTFHRPVAAAAATAWAARLLAIYHHCACSTLVAAQLCALAFPLAHCEACGTASSVATAAAPATIVISCIPVAVLAVVVATVTSSPLLVFSPGSSLPSLSLLLLASPASLLNAPCCQPCYRRYYYTATDGYVVTHRNIPSPYAAAAAAAAAATYNTPTRNATAAKFSKHILEYHAPTRLSHDILEG